MLSKKVMALWRYRPKACGPTSAMQLSNRKRKKVNRVKVGSSHSKALSTPTGTKRKRERAIEDSYGDPHTFCCPQRHVLHRLTCVRVPLFSLQVRLVGVEGMFMLHGVLVGCLFGTCSLVCISYSLFTCI